MPEELVVGGPGIGGSPSIDGNLPTPPPIPQRRATIGAIQELSEDDVKFLEFAFVHDIPVQLQMKNPKQAGSASRLRYDKYKSAMTQRGVKNKGGMWKDILWEFSFHGATSIFGIFLAQLECRYPTGGSGGISGTNFLRFSLQTMQGHRN